MEFENFYIPSGNSRLDAQLKFTAEIDRMTQVYRKTLLIDRSRAENDAEHSWHIAVMALLFEEYAIEKVDIRHAIEMLIVHDLIEIYAGDTFAYDTEANKTKAEREEKAAEKLFSILPPEQGGKIRALWEEFDAHSTPDARYADCLDKLQPYFHNILTEGYTWRNAIAGRRTTKQQVARRLSPIKDFMPEVYKWVEKTMNIAVERQWLLEE